MSVIVSDDFPPSPADLTFPPASIELISTRPIIVRRRVTFGDCDPARIVYTPVFAEYLACAFDYVLRVFLDDKWPLAGNVMTPMRGLTLDFQSMLTVGDFFDMHCYIAEIRTRTFDIFVSALNADGRVAFQGTMTPIMVDRATRTSTSIPAEFSEKLRRYQTLFPAPPKAAA